MSSRSERGGEMHAWRAASLLGALTAVVVIVLTYWPVLTAGAISLDDDVYLRHNPRTQNPGWDSVRRVFSEVLKPFAPGYYEPLAVISLMFDSAQGGRMDNLRPFHRTSLALHAANTVLVIVLFYLLLDAAARRAGPAAESKQVGSDLRVPWVAAAVGLLFGLHPLTVESVALVAQRKVLLAAFFSFGSLALYAQYVRKGRRGFLGAALAAYILALLSKPTSTPLPIIMLLLDFWPLRRLSRRAVLEKVPFFVVGAVSAAITVVACARTSGITLPGESGSARTPLTMAYLVSFYVSKVFWPANLSSVYSLPQPFSLSNPTVALGVAGTCGLVAGSILSLRWSRAILTGAMVFVVAIFPTMGAIGYTWVTAADKHVYLPSVGFLLCLAWLLSRLVATAPGGRLPAFRAVTLAAVAILAASEAATTRRVISRWRDTEERYRYMLALAPRAAILHCNLGNTLAERGRQDDAIEHFVRALDLKPDYADAHNNLALALEQRGETDRAIAHLSEALRLRPNYVEAENNLGMLWVRRGRLDEAARCFTRALAINPSCFEAHSNLAMVLLEQGRTDEAIRHYTEAVRTDDACLPAWLNLAKALLAKGSVDEALAACRRAVAIGPGDPMAHYAMGIVLQQKGLLEEAVREYQRVLEIDPRHESARKQLAAAMAARGAGAGGPPPQP